MRSSLSISSSCPLLSSLLILFPSSPFEPLIILSSLITTTLSHIICPAVLRIDRRCHLLPHGINFLGCQTLRSAFQIWALKVIHGPSQPGTSKNPMSLLPASIPCSWNPVLQIGISACLPTTTIMITASLFPNFPRLLPLNLMTTSRLTLRRRTAICYCRPELGFGAHRQLAQISCRQSPHSTSASSSLMQGARVKTVSLRLVISPVSNQLRHKSMDTPHVCPLWRTT